MASIYSYNLKLHAEIELTCHMGNWSAMLKFGRAVGYGKNKQEAIDALVTLVKEKMMYILSVPEPNPYVISYRVSG